jgi:VanZ family protein
MWDKWNGATRPGRRAWALVGAWAVVIFLLSSIPGSAIPEVPGRYTDKVVHVLVYAVLGLLLGRALAATATANATPTPATKTALRRASTVVVVCVLATSYGITDELHQLFTPRRSCDWHDVVADAVGGLLGGVLAATVLSRESQRRPPTSRRGKGGAAV